MRQTDDKIITIANRVGYSDIKFLTRSLSGLQGKLRVNTGKAYTAANLVKLQVTVWRYSSQYPFFLSMEWGAKAVPYSGPCIPYNFHILAYVWHSDCLQGL